MSISDHQNYIQTKINPILEALVTETLLEKPDEPIEFMVKWLCSQLNPNPLQKLEEENMEMKAKLQELNISMGPPKTEDYEDEEDEDEDEDDEDIGELPEFIKKRGMMPRVSVSAEAYGKWNQKKEFTPPVYPKSEDQVLRLKTVLSNSFMFKALDKKDLETIVNAMQEKVLKAGERPIKQGDDGDVLYVIEKGTLDCFKLFPDSPEEKLVKTVCVGDVFGELALLYNVPRAASVEARDEATVWTLDRESFNAIVKDAAQKKRELYEKFLTSVPLLESMDVYERNKIADALQTETFQDGEHIVKQGEPGDRFYLLVDGKAVAMKSFVKGQEPKKVMDYAAGSYFGELALLKNEPRAASVISQGPCTCATLDRKSFGRLLGSLEEILKRSADKYE